MAKKTTKSDLIDSSAAYTKVTVRSYAHGQSYDNLVADIQQLQTHLKAGLTTDCFFEFTFVPIQKKGDKRALIAELKSWISVGEMQSGNVRQIAGALAKFATDNNLQLDECTFTLIRPISARKIPRPKGFIPPKWLPEAYLACSCDGEIYFVLNDVPSFNEDGAIDDMDGYVTYVGMTKSFSEFNLKPGEYVRLK